MTRSGSSSASPPWMPSPTAGPRSCSGRGSFIESFPLFGLDLADYEVLFEEKLELFDKARAQKPIHWEGRTRPRHQRAERLSAAGAPPAAGLDRRRRHSRVRAALRRIRLPDHLRHHRRPAARPSRPLANLYREAMAKYGHPMQQMATHSPGHIAETDEEAREEFFPHWLGAAEPDRRRARLGAGQPGRIRRHVHARGRPVRRLPGDRGAEDRPAQAEPRRGPLRPQIQQRNPAAQGDDALASSCSAPRWRPGWPACWPASERPPDGLN